MPKTFRSETCKRSKDIRISDIRISQPKMAWCAKISSDFNYSLFAVWSLTTNFKINASEELWVVCTIVPCLRLDRIVSNKNG